MDMTWQALLQEAAATSFDNTADTLAAAENDGYICDDLSLSQVNELSEKILLLPQYGGTLLLSRYCFRLSPEETENLFGLENAKGRFRFYRQLLSSSMGLDEGCIIADDPLEKACQIAMENYLHTEFEESGQPHKVRKKFWKTVAVAATRRHCCLLPAWRQVRSLGSGSFHGWSRPLRNTVFLRCTAARGRI